MVHRLFFGQVIKPSIRRKWLMDFSDTEKSNIAFRVLRTLVGGSYKYGQYKLALREKALKVSGYQIVLKALTIKQST